MEKEFPHDHAIAREVLFEITDVFEALLPNLLANKFWRQFLVRKEFRGAQVTKGQRNKGTVMQRCTKQRIIAAKLQSVQGAVQHWNNETGLPGVRVSGSQRIKTGAWGPMGAYGCSLPPPLEV